MYVCMYVSMYIYIYCVRESYPHLHSIIIFAIAVFAELYRHCMRLVSGPSALGTTAITVIRVVN